MSVAAPDVETIEHLDFEPAPPCDCIGQRCTHPRLACDTAADFYITPRIPCVKGYGSLYGQCAPCWDRKAGVRYVCCHSHGQLIDRDEAYRIVGWLA